MTDIANKTPEKIVKELVSEFSKHSDWNNQYGSPEEQACVKNAHKCAKIALELALSVCPMNTYGDVWGSKLIPVPNPTYTKLKRAIEIIEKELK